MRSSSEKSNGNRYATFPNMGDNHILFQSGKRRMEFPAQIADESFGDNATIGGNLTPLTTTRTKIKLVKMSPAESLQPYSDVRIYNRNTSGSDDGTHELKRTNAHCEEHAGREKIHVCGSLNMLVDAIQLVEDLEPQEFIGPKAQKKDLVCFVPDNIRQGNNLLGRPILQSNRYWANGVVDTAISQVMDAECIPDKVDVDVGETMPLTRSRRGWLPTLPSKYSDSVLQPWKKVTRKVPKF